MPLMNKKPFKLNTIPDELSDTDKVFYCRVTNEIFVNYQDYAERIILCNSLVWSCEETGKSGLTYIEAITSERRARRLLQSTPKPLRDAILYLVTLTNRPSLSELCEEIYAYVRDRFFVGEMVQVNLGNENWILCKILQVISENVKNGTKSSHDKFWPPASCYRYQVRVYGRDVHAAPTGQVLFAVSNMMRRPKRVFSKDRCYRLVRQSVTRSNGVWRLKSSIRHRCRFLDFSNIFAGHPPKFSAAALNNKKHSPRKTPVPAAKVITPHRVNGVTKKAPSKKQESLEKYLRPKTENKQNAKHSPSKSDKKSSLAKEAARLKQLQQQQQNAKKRKQEALDRELAEKRRKMEEHQRQVLERRQRKQLDIQKRRDEKRRLEEFAKEWNKTREDLELEDLMELPTPTTVQLETPNELFGELAMLYEFFRTFSDLLQTKLYFPAGVTLELLDRAMTVEEIAGPLNDILQLLLIGIFRAHNDEEDEIGESYDSLALNEYDTLDCSKTDVATKATIVVNWSYAFQGVPLCEMTLDGTTITEVLRLHLLSSGCRVSDNCTRWRIQEKAGYSPVADDAGISFCIKHPDIIRHLSEQHVGLLRPTEKCAVLQTLVNQYVVYDGPRQFLNERAEAARVKRNELKAALLVEQKNERKLILRKKEKEKKPAEKPIDEGSKAVSQDDPSAKKESINEKDDKEIERLEKDIQKKKEEINKQLREVDASSSEVQQLWLGTDRAYRRYWLLTSLGGVYVEDDEPHRGSCLARGTPTPNATLMRENDTLAYVRKLFEEECNKENLAERTTASPAPKYERNAAPLSCWADASRCPVHGTDVLRIRWSYFHTAQQFEKLIGGLNGRGKRESRLKAALLQRKEQILESLNRVPMCLRKDDVNGDGSASSTSMAPSASLPSGSSSSSNSESRRWAGRGSLNSAYEDTMLDSPPGTTVEKALELSLRHFIVDMEEKSNAGGLGSLFVFDRLQWIEALKNNKYDKSCEMLQWGPKPADLSDEINADAKDSKSGIILKASTYSNLEKFIPLYRYAETVNPVVKELASAILQLEQSISRRYLKKPLGPDLAKNTKDNNRLTISNIVGRWEWSLMASVSFAQLFVHLCTLDNSICWNKSALNAFCRICRRRGDGENMLLCDQCNKGHHMYCLKPKLTKVPKGNWFCDVCKPLTNGRKERKKRSYINESDDDGMERKRINNIELRELTGKHKCNICQQKGMTIVCAKCDNYYHLGCLMPPLRKVPTINWTCHSCRFISAKKADQSEENGGDGSEDSWSQSGASIRLSRRKTSKAANQKISEFVKRLRTPDFPSSDDDYDQDDDTNEDSDSTTKKFVRSKSRRTNRNSMSNKYMNTLPLDNATLQDLLEKVMRHADAWPFLKPVTRYEAADYHLIVKRPMDFATIKHKLNMFHYHTNSQVISDSMLVFHNCFLYNKEGSDVYESGVRLMNFFKTLCIRLNLKRELQEAETQLKRTQSDDESNLVEEMVVEDEMEESESENEQEEALEEKTIDEEQNEEETEDEVEEEEEEEENENENDEEEDIGDEETEDMDCDQLSVEEYSESSDDE